MSQNYSAGLGKTLNDIFGSSSRSRSPFGQPKPKAKMDDDRSQGDDKTPQALFKTLRRLHGQNLDHAGLNDLTDAFQSFMTRARFFAIGRIRRTWSHSAVEFMKYRRRLPALMGGDDDEDNDNAHAFSMSHGICASARRPSIDSSNASSRQSLALPAGSQQHPNQRHSMYESIVSSPTDLAACRVQISNVAPNVTASQLTSFLSKFGPIATCQMPTETLKSGMNAGGNVPLNPYSSLPRRRGKGIAFVTFKREADADSARAAVAEELLFYGRVLVVSQVPQPKMSSSSSRRSEAGDRRSCNLEDEDAQSLCSSTEYSVDEPADEAVTGVSPFDVLEDRVLVRIINYLTLVERIRVERVNKRWMELAYRSWRTCTHLRITSEQLSVNERIRPLQTSWLCSLLHRCGRYVQSLDLSATPHLLDDCALASIAQYCTQLKSINLSGLRLRWQSVKQFSEICTGLEQVTYNNGEHTGEKVFWHLFRGCQNLRRVDLAGCRRLQGRCFRLLGLWLDQVIVNGCHRLEAEAIEEICLKSPNVSELKLDDCYNVDDACLGLMARSLNNLSSLSLCGVNCTNLSTSGLINVAHLSSLRDVRLDGQPGVEDTLVDALVDGLPALQTLSLAGCHKLNADAIKQLAECACLTHINLSHVPAVNDDCLSHLLAKTVNLINLKIRGCARLTGTGLTPLDKCPNVACVDLSGCMQLDAACIRSVIGCVRQSTAPHVVLVVGGTKCTANDVKVLQQSITGSRVLLDTGDYSSSGIGTAPAFVSASNSGRRSGGGYVADDLQSDDDYTSDDEFESLSQHRSFIMDRLEEDELIPPEGQPLSEAAIEGLRIDL